MRVYLTKDECERMKNNITDEETGCTEWDIFEFEHQWGEIIIEG